MHFKSILLTLAATTTTLVAGHGYWCPMATDNTGMIQDPYCCDSFSATPGDSVALEGHNCQPMDGLEWVDQCPQGGSVKCCYTIGQAFICSAEAEENTDDDDE
ncbi:hypothetical protein AbraIFM66951_006395 [Aspergillus brasiliensis]|uniref:Hydrophobin n=1 Tax=Aspergillus brasiliensis TaxID=319629 RepID=A0A9W5YI20_9EURO|nr:hypothetical protein AbraCBS73388_004288 [Aspergillus brasiliensis]GKZ32379.1 hypothetical protein AbraIFM66950_001732 [Aspergillus brasiliensis]GKZ40857.1 hypothetical protein AbraIFM66951_006395 [Aspergillus brasiliensis]